MGAPLFPLPGGCCCFIVGAGVWLVAKGIRLAGIFVSFLFSSTRRCTMLRSLLLSCSLLCLVLMTSCATLIDKGPDSVPVTSTPLGASVYLDGTLVGRTPTTISVPRSAKGVVTVFLEGYYPPAAQQIGTSFNPWLLGNVLMGYFSLPGLLIDLLAGNGSTWNENPLHFNLIPMGKS